MISGFFLTGGPGGLNSDLRCVMHGIFDLMYISAELTSKVKRSYGPLFPRLMYHLVPILSSVLFVFTQAFHIFYSDQIELVSVFPILIKLNRFQLFYLSIGIVL